MFLRIVKVVAQQGDNERIAAELRRYVVEFLRKQEGVKWVNLLQDVDLPSKYFIQSYWDTIEQLQAATAKQANLEYRTLIHPYLQERISVWVLKLLDGQSQSSFLEPQCSFVRFARLVVIESELEAKIQDAISVTVPFTRESEGCSTARLYQEVNHKTALFLESWWASKEDLLDALSSSMMRLRKQEAANYLEQRMGVWTLRIIDRYPAQTAITAES